MTTTISDDQKKNAATLYEALKALRASQRKWGERIFCRAPESLAKPDWKKLRMAALQVLKVLELDSGPRSDSFTANLQYIRDVGIQRQIIDLTILTQHERHLLETALQDIENESRRMAGIKRRPLFAVATGHDRTDIKMPAHWFDKRTGGVLSADQLSKAYRAHRITGEKRGGRNYYSVDSVIAVYPEQAPSLKTEKH